ncbi:MAG TPA: cyclic nucleotide-binding domain-containing protein [Acidimicrobiia bacterium]|nr:cyclic nucleotide-binding domain-containing protein [Acidimicrobiia bacterium]
MARRPRSEIVELVRSVPLFSGLTKSDMREIGKLCFEQSFEPEQVILKQLEEAQLMVAILSGKARIVKDGKTITTVGPGDAIGEMSLIDGRRRSASVVAETPVECVVIHRTTFTKLLDSSPSIARKLLISQTERLRDTNNKLAALG